MTVPKFVRPIAVVVGFILLVPLIAMQFTEQVKWSLLDFVLMGALLFSTGIAYERAARIESSIAYRAATGLTCATMLILLWVNAAVGIIGDGPVNLLYFGVLAILILGALLARLQSRGMARVLFTVAVAQLLVPILALVIGHPLFDPFAAPVFGLNAIFAVAFAGAGRLYRRAARKNKKITKPGEVL